MLFRSFEEIPDEEFKTGRETWQDASKIDSFKNSSAAIKLLVATLPMHNKSTGRPLVSSIGGVVLLPASQAWITIMNTVHDAKGLDDMLSKLRGLAKEDPDYRRVYKRVTGNDYTDESVDYSALKSKSALKLVSSFWRSFKKANPDVKVVYYLEDGEIIVTDANFNTAARQTENDFEQAIKETFLESNKLYTFNKEKGVHVQNVRYVNSIKPEDGLEVQVEFLKTLGIDFDVKQIEKKLSGEEIRDFTAAVTGILKSIKERPELRAVTKKSLEISGRLLRLSQLHTVIKIGRAHV